MLETLIGCSSDQPADAGGTFLEVRVRAHFPRKRLRLEGSLWIGQFPDRAAAMGYHADLASYIDTLPKQSVKRPQFRRGKYEVPTERAPRITLVRNEYAIAVLLPAQLKELRREFHIFTPEEREVMVSQVPYHLLVRAVDLMVPRRVI